MALGKCKDCQYWDRTVGTDNGICRKYPPSILTQGSIPWRQPETDKNVVCNEFLAKE